MKECYKSRWRCTEGYYPSLSFCGSEPEDTTHDLLEEVSSQMGTSPRAPFRFTQYSRLPSIWSLQPKGRQACSMTPNNWMHYCVHIRVTLGNEVGNQPPPSHAWSWSLIANMFQDGLKEWITEPVVLEMGKPFHSLEEDLAKRVSSTPVQGIMDSAWQVQILGLGEQHKWKWLQILCKKAIELLQILSWRRKWRPGAQGTPKGWGEPSSPQLVPVMYMIEWEAWMREHPMGRWEGLVMPVLEAESCLVDDAGDREHQGFLEVLPEAHPLQGVGVLIEEVIKALTTQQW